MSTEFYWNGNDKARDIEIVLDGVIDVTKRVPLDMSGSGGHH